MTWPPFFEMDLIKTGFLPSGWAHDVNSLAASTHRQIIAHEMVPDSPDNESWSFSVVTGDYVRESLDWLWTLYHGVFRDFASVKFGIPLYPANRLDATTTLNILAGPGARNEWHQDANPVSGLFFATSLAHGDGGELQFRSLNGQLCEFRPRAGRFICFEGSCEHQVRPLRTKVRRIAFPMTYYTSIENQPFANENNRYEI
jgi:2OG-Fe(II) oxygenase superfamily